MARLYKIGFVAFIGFCTLIVAKDEHQFIRIVNKSSQSVLVRAKSNNLSLHIEYVIDPYTKSCITIDISKLIYREQKLFKAILADSKEKIQKAVRTGSDINGTIEGKEPLLWALLLRKKKAESYLVSLGAAL